MTHHEIEIVQQRIQENINNDSWLCIGVDGTPVFTYTIGLHHRNLPELIIAGLPPDVSTMILNGLGRIMVTDGPFKHGSKIEELVSVPVFIIDASENKKREFTTQAFNFYQDWNYALQQIVFPGNDNRFHWESGCSEDLLLFSPLMGNPPLEKMN